jgi:hypothetical protein
MTLFAHVEERVQLAAHFEMHIAGSLINIVWDCERELAVRLRAWILHGDFLFPFLSLSTARKPFPSAKALDIRKRFAT